MEYYQALKRNELSSHERYGGTLNAYWMKNDCLYDILEKQN